MHKELPQPTVFDGDFVMRTGTVNSFAARLIFPCHFFRILSDQIGSMELVELALSHSMHDTVLRWLSRRLDSFRFLTQVWLIYPAATPPGNISTQIPYLDLLWMP